MAAVSSFLETGEEVGLVNDDEGYQKEAHDENVNNINKGIDGEDDVGNGMNSKDDDAVRVDDEEEEEELTLGGTIDSPSFALLQGKLQVDASASLDSKTKKDFRMVSVELTRLPAILGRTHMTNDPKFFGLGPAKALSRQHCAIFYRDAVGGRLGQYNEDIEQQPPQLQDESTKSENPSTKLVYLPPSKRKRKNNSNASNNEDGEGVGNNNDDKDELICLSQYEDSLPENGFFAVECLGKNKIFVNGKRVKQGQVAMLEHGSTLRMANYYLYFLLPKSTVSSSEFMQVPNPAYEAYQRQKAAEASQQDKKPSSDISDDDDDDDDDDDSNNEDDNSNNEDNDEDNDDKDREEEERPAKKQKQDSSNNMFSLKLKTKSSTGGTSMSYDHVSTKRLMKEFHRAFESNTLERKHQMMSTAITQKAALDAAKDPAIRKQCEEEGGISRMDIIDWVANSKKYKKWVKQLLSKLEFKSYQANMTKALMKADFARVGSTGRHVKWKLPDLKSLPKEDDDEEEDDNEDNEDNDDDDSDDDDDDNSDDNDEVEDDEEEVSDGEENDDDSDDDDGSDKSNDDDPEDKEQVHDSDSDSSD